MRLTREVRFWSGEPQGVHGARNSWAGAPGGQYSEAFWTLRAEVEGCADASTGFVCDIRAIDEWLLGEVATTLRQSMCLHDGTPTSPAAACLVAVAQGKPPALPASIRVHALEWALSPQTRYTVLSHNPTRVFLSRAFEFSASHRLACPGFSDEQNRRVFGKCSNPHGHGHNYVFEVTLDGTPDETTGQVFPMPELDRIVQERVVEPFDHKNLNVECSAFAAVNPTVENIARVIFERLGEAFKTARLAHVKVWETPKTSAECTAEDVLGGSDGAYRGTLGRSEPCAGLP